MYVNVKFKNGEIGRILKSEYEANKDKGYIDSLIGNEKQIIPKAENKMVDADYENKSQKPKTK